MFAISNERSVSTQPWTQVFIVLAAAAWLTFAATVSVAQLNLGQPADLEGAGIDEKLDGQIPLDLQFRDSRGRAIKLDKIFDGQRPVVLSLNYSDCPMLCQVQLNGLVEALRSMDWRPGQEFDLVSVSIDPLETPQRARQTKQRYLKLYGRTETADGWHFLVGSKQNIERLAAAIGFRFKYVPERREYAHAAAIMICTPDGRVSRYLYGVAYEPKTLRLSLVEAGEGKIGSAMDQLLLFCFHYDATSGRYGPIAMRMMQLGGLGTLVVLLAVLLPVWLRRRRLSVQTTCFAVQPLVAEGSIWFPPARSTVAGGVDELFYFILGICIVFFVIIVGLMAVFVLRYRRRIGETAAGEATHSTLLETVWSVIPAVLAGMIFVWGFNGYVNMRQPPDDAYEIQVIAKKWSWSFLYTNGHVDNNLHAPVDRPIRLVMTSDDVIHSLYVPAFRIKMDVVPGRYTKTWFQATEPGEFTLFCAEYCGTQHSNMLAKVIVHPTGEFAKWLDDAANFMNDITPVEAGEILYQRRGCIQCHSVDGSAKVGPTFKEAFGSRQGLVSGESIVVDENYLRQSILEPQAKVRAGYRPVMPTYQGQLSDEEIAALIAFIKSLKEELP